MEETTPQPRARARKKRRARSPHPGVVLLAPEASSGHAAWRARFRDPDTGRMKKVRLDPADVTTADARREWAIRKSKQLGKRRTDLELGAPRGTGIALADATAKFFKANARLRPATITLYRMIEARFLAWAKAEGIKSADDLTRGKLAEYRNHLADAPRLVHASGEGRKKMRADAEQRSGHTINSDLRKTGTILRHLVEIDLLPKLTDADIKRSLKKVEVVHELHEYLRPSELQQLLEAALRHDADTFKATRAEHAAGAEGVTRRYDPIAPFVAYVLLTGCRLGEALAVEWRNVDLDALDNAGNKTGEIRLEGKAVKTKKARTIDLAVSPGLRTMLAAMKLKSGGKRGPVFPFGEGTADAAAKRLRKDYGAPESFTWQALRRTCGTFLTNSPGIFGSASAYRSAAQLGHGVETALRHYVGLARGIPATAHSLEAAMQIEKQLARVIAVVGGSSSAATVHVLASADGAL